MLICLLESLLIEWTQIEGVLLICFAAAFKWGINRTSVPSVKNQWGVSHHATCLEARQAWTYITLGVTLWMTFGNLFVGKIQEENLKTSTLI